MQLKNARNPIRKIFVLTFLLSFLLINTNFDTKLFNTNDLVNDKKNTHINVSQTSLYEYSGVGAAQNVTEFGQGFFQNNNINITNSENASIIVPNNWEASEILSNIINIYEYDKLWMNKTFDSGYDTTVWSNYTSDPTKINNITFGWYNDPLSSNDSIYMKFINASTVWDDVDSYWNYTFYLDREEIPYKEWSIDFNYRFLTNNNTWLSAGGATKLYCTIIVNGIATQFNLAKFNTHINNTWYSDNIEPFSPELYYYDPPGIVNVLFGIDWGKNLVFNPTGDLKLYFDNISLNLQTIPKPSQINLSITDYKNGETKQISDLTGYGKGTIFFDNNWFGTVGGTTHKFSFSSNSSGNVFINTDFFVNATSSSFTTTELAIKGSEFFVENETRTIWTMYFPVSIPGSYQTNYFFNLSKPTNWNVTHIIDPYGNDKISQVLETSGPGNTTLVIPKEIIVNGRWKIVAESPNYVINTKIWKWIDTSWEESNNFETSEILKINATIDTDLIPNLELTNLSLMIYYPNGTEWFQAHQELSPDSFGNIEFNTLTLGAINASAGTFTINIRWQNQEFTQIGFSSLNFENIHNTILQRANDQDPIVTPIYTGDTVLIKVNYTDIDIGVGIIEAHLNYTIDNETVITGDMVYFGGGIYVAEIDTTNWQNGLYNVSISADKPYYKSQYEDSIIQLEVTERTTLISPQKMGVVVPWGNNKTINVSYNGSNNQGISGANIDCDWDLNYYMIQEVGLGHYIIMLNTTIKTIDSYTLKINASKEGYENREIYLLINVRNIYTNLSYIQPEPVNLNSNVSIQFEFSDIDSNILISGAHLTISSQLSSQYWDSNNYYYFEPTLGIYNVTFNSFIFNGAGTFQIYVTLDKTYYSNASTLINIFVIDISTSLNLYLDGVDKTIDGYIERTVNQLVNITVAYKDSLTEDHIGNALIKLTGGDISENLTENEILKHYCFLINTTNLNQGINFLTIYAQKGGYIPYSLLFTVEIKERETSMQLLLNGENKTLEQSIELPIRANLNITIKFTDVETDHHVGNATVQLIGEGLSLLLMENFALEQYSIILNTNQLDIGLRFLSIYAQKSNYQPFSALLRINVKRINTEITTTSGETTINSRPGESVTLSLILNDLDFNKTVKNASVTYTWAFGQGTFSDSDNDGIYEVLLVNLPEGIHTLTISVYAGDDYDFRRFELTLNVISLPENVILFQILTVLSVIAALGVGGYLVAYQKVFKYPKTVRKIHKFKKSIKKGKDRPNVEILSREELIKKHYEENLGYLSKSIEDKNNKDKLKQHIN